MMSNSLDDQQKIAKLERELEEMTAALSHTWDQLVPFLQETPAQAQTTQDIIPTIQAVMAATDAEFGGIYLKQHHEWHSVPDGTRLSFELQQQLQSILPDQTLQWVEESTPPPQWLFAAIVSEKRVVGALGIGVQDRERVFTAADQRIVIRMSERVSSQIAEAQLLKSREREAQLQREMEIANEIQQSIQPQSPPVIGQVHIASYWHPARQVGGDAWGWVHQPDGKLEWFMLDVAGKGLPAALAAMSLCTAIRMGLRMRLSPAEVLRLINDEFYDAYTITGLMATVAILSFHPDLGTLELANAGHPPTLIRQGRRWQHLLATAPPVGVLPDLQADTIRMTLKPADLILCYSDGFTEIQTEAGLWGENGLLASIPDGETNVEVLTQHIVTASKRAGAIQDDQTLIIVGYHES